MLLGHGLPAHTELLEGAPPGDSRLRAPRDTVSVPDIDRAPAPPLTPGAVRAHLDALAKPPGSLGRLEDVAVALAVASQSLRPATRPRRVVLFAGDHGVVASGVTAWPSEVTTAMIATIASGRASSSALAGVAGCRLRLVDVGSQKPLGVAESEGYAERRVSAGTADLAEGPAMTSEQLHAAWEVGADEARTALDAGDRLLLTGEMGIGNTTPAACLTALLTGVDPVTAVGPGAGADPQTLARKQRVVAAAVTRERPLLDADPVAAVAALGGLEIAAMAGFLAEGARGGAVLLLDGYVATAAALVAERLAPGTRARMLAGHLSAESGHRHALDALGLEPVLDWGMRLGEGTGALTALPLLDAAVALLGDVAALSEVLG